MPFRLGMWELTYYRFGMVRFTAKGWLGINEWHDVLNFVGYQYLVGVLYLISTFLYTAGNSWWHTLCSCILWNVKHTKLKMIQWLRSYATSTEVSEVDWLNMWSSTNLMCWPREAMALQTNDDSPQGNLLGPATAMIEINEDFCWAMFSVSLHSAI